jgi:hypothetical protein
LGLNGGKMGKRNQATIITDVDLENKLVFYACNRAARRELKKKKVSHEIIKFPPLHVNLMRHQDGRIEKIYTFGRGGEVFDVPYFSLAANRAAKKRY